MPSILVVDDSAIDRCLLEGLLKRDPSFSIRCVEHGAAAIALLQSPDHGVDLVVSDLNMPEIDGLQLVTFMRMACPSIPVVLMTANGSEELAVQALELGAASYVTKKNLADKLNETVQHVLELVSATRGSERLSACTSFADLEFQLPNDESLFTPLIEMVRQIGTSMGIWPAREELRLAVALEEALHYALYCGNLELTSELANNGQWNSAAAQQIIAARKLDPEFAGRMLRVRVSIRPAEARVTLQHSGAGFDANQLPSIDDKHAVLDERFRGIVLMRAFMDEVIFSDDGNELRLVKRAVRDEDVARVARFARTPGLQEA